MRTKISLAVVFLLIQLAHSQSTSKLIPPYLQAVTTNSIYVLVESLSVDSVTVEFGTTTAYGSSSPVNSWSIGLRGIGGSSSRGLVG